jgi:hypothetical protein
MQASGAGKVGRFLAFLRGVCVCVCGRGGEGRTGPRGRDRIVWLLIASGYRGRTIHPSPSFLPPSLLQVHTRYYTDARPLSRPPFLAPPRLRPRVFNHVDSDENLLLAQPLSLTSAPDSFNSGLCLGNTSAESNFIYRFNGPDSFIIIDTQKTIIASFGFLTPSFFNIHVSLLLYAILLSTT